MPYSPRCYNCGARRVEHVGDALQCPQAPKPHRSGLTWKPYPRHTDRRAFSVTSDQLKWLQTLLKTLTRGGDARVLVRAPQCREVLYLLRPR